MATLELSRDELVAEMDRVSNARLGMTAQEVLRRYNTGDLDDPGAVGDVLILADLLDDDDPILAS